MYSVKSPLIFVCFLLYFSPSDAGTANLDPTKYTVVIIKHFHDNSTLSCLGGILGEDLVISTPSCYENLSKTPFGPKRFKYMTVETIDGSVEVPVTRIEMPKTPQREGSDFIDYALIHLGQNLNLETNGLIKLTLPTYITEVGSSAALGNVYANETEIVKFIDMKFCSEGTEMFDGKSYLCAKAPKSNSLCYSALGSPLVTQAENGTSYVIGVYGRCRYRERETKMLVFGRTYSGSFEFTSILPVEDREK